MAEIVPGKTCPACGTPYDFGTGQDSTRVYGREYRWRYALNKVVKCTNCGNVHSWVDNAQGS